jgi:hypothetical protein
MNWRKTGIAVVLILGFLLGSLAKNAIQGRSITNHPNEASLHRGDSMQEKVVKRRKFRKSIRIHESRQD